MINENDTDAIRVEFDSLETETDAAYAVKIDSDIVWLPKSHCRMYPNKCVAYVSEWLAYKKGLV